MISSMGFDGNGLINAGINPGNTPVVVASGSPAYVPMQPASTSPAPSPVQYTGTPTPSTVQDNPQASTVLTSAGGLLSEVGTIVSSPTKHILGVFVLLVLGWFFYKGLKHL